MANLTSNSLFIVTGVVIAVSLLFVAYPYLTLTAVTICGLTYTYVNYGRSLDTSWFHNYLGHLQAYASSLLWPDIGDSEGTSSYAPNLLTGVDLPSPIPHVPSGLETVRNRRSPADEIISSTPRSSPVSGPGVSATLSVPLPLRSSPEAVATDSRQLNFGRINTPRSSRLQVQDSHRNHVESNSNQKLWNRSNNAKTIQTTAGPLLSSPRHNPAFDAGIFVNVNSPGFTDRLVRCANDNPAFNWGHGSLSTQQDRYSSVGLFPIVHLNSSPPPSLNAKNTLKGPNSSVRVKIAPPIFADHSQPRQQSSRGNNIQMRPYISVRKNEIAKSVLESLQEASRKRIYSQCQEVLEDESGKKRQRKGDSALPNPNCDMYQYRHIRAPPVPSTSNSVQLQGKRLHDDPSKANEPKRQRHQGKCANNEISSSLSSSKTLLQRLSGNKRKADCYEYVKESKGKQFKDSFNEAPTSAASQWRHSHPGEVGESSARTKEVVRIQEKPSSDSTPNIPKQAGLEMRERAAVPDRNTIRSTSSEERKKASMEKVSDKVDTDLTAKLFRKDVVSRAQPKANLPEKKGSSWSQIPPEADERCLMEQDSTSELDRPERFQSLLSRMCGQDIRSVQRSEISQITSEPRSSFSNPASSNLGKIGGKQVTQPIKAISSSDAPVTFSPPAASVSNPVGQIETNHEFASKASASKSESSAMPSPTVSTLVSASNTTSPFQLSSPVPTSHSSAVVSTVNGESNASEKQDQTDGPSSSVPTLSNVTSASTSAKPMFNFNPPSSQATPHPPIQQTASPAIPSTSSTSTTSFAQSIVKFCPSPSEPNPKPADQKIPPVYESSLQPSKPFQSGFSFLMGVSQPSQALQLPHPPQVSQAPIQPSQPQTSAIPLLASCAKSPVPSSTVAVSFAAPNQKLQFSTSSSSFSPLQKLSQVNGPTSVTFTTSSTSIFTATMSNNSQRTEPSQTTTAQKSPFGGFSFKESSGSGSLFSGQSSKNDSATTPSFSFTSPSTSVAVSDKVTSESKSVTGSGSITFGTVSTAVNPPTNPICFNFSNSSTAKSATTEAANKTAFQLGTPGVSSTNANSLSSGFSNPPQGLFNGFGSITNPTTPAAPSFGAPQQNQQQSQGAGGFSFGSAAPNQHSAPLAFGAVAPASSSSIFGEGASQQPSFGTTTASGFSLQSAVPSFSSPPFGAPTSVSSSPFGSSKPLNAAANPFGGQASSSNPPAFGLSSSFGNSSLSSVAPTFGATSPPTFGSSLPTESTFGSNAPSGPTSTISSAFGFGASTEKQAVPTFNFGGNSTSPNPTFNFGSTEQQQPNNNSALFQFGQAASPSSAFQFGSPSAQPGVFSFGSSSPSFGTATNPVPLGSFTIGSGGFSMGSGPSTPPRSRTLQTRRRRI